MALQTREQHIRREKATSNICTAQVLLAVMASMYAVYHGPHGLRRIARRVHALTVLLKAGLRKLGYDAGSGPFFDTLRVRLAPGQASRLLEAARARRINLRTYADGSLGIALDETTLQRHLTRLLEVFAEGRPLPFTTEQLGSEADHSLPVPFARTSSYLLQDVFNRHHSEHEMLRYMQRLQDRDLSLTTSMIPLGSCTMKLNGRSEMIPATWPEFARLHPPRGRARATRGSSSSSRRGCARSRAWRRSHCGQLRRAGSTRGFWPSAPTMSRGDAHRDVC
jgi:glycine dehydrogenase